MASALRRFGASALRRFGASALRRFGASALRRFGASALRRFGASALRRFGASALRRFGASALRRFGASALRRFGASALRRFGASALRRFGASALIVPRARACSARRRWRARRCPCSWLVADGASEHVKLTLLTHQRRSARFRRLPGTPAVAAHETERREPAIGSRHSTSQALPTLESRTLRVKCACEDQIYGVVSINLTPLLQAVRHAPPFAGRQPEQIPTGRGRTRLPRVPPVARSAGPRIPHLTPALSSPAGRRGREGRAAFVPPPPGRRGTGGGGCRSGRRCRNGAILMITTL